MLECAPGHTGPLCSHCQDAYTRSGLSGPCFRCEDGGSSAVVIGLAVLGTLLLVAGLWRYLHVGNLIGSAQVNAVLSFGARGGGFGGRPVALTGLGSQAYRGEVGRIMLLELRGDN